MPSIGETSPQGPDILTRWLETIDQSGLEKVFEELTRWSSLGAAVYRARGGAAWALTNAPALEELYRLSYPEAVYQHERLRLLEVDLVTMNLHHRLIGAMIENGEELATEIQDQLLPLLNGTTDGENLPAHLPLDNLAASAAGQRRIATGISSEMKIMAAQVRFRSEGRQDIKLLDWREAVVSTLGLNAQEETAARTLGIYLDARAETN